MGDYPEDEDLESIKKWPHQDFHGLMEFIKGIWWCSDWGFSEKDGIYSLSTGGWSGNEEIIGAMRQNYIFWSLCWMSSRRGGHHEFEIPEVKQ